MLHNKMGAMHLGKAIMPLCCKADVHQSPQRPNFPGLLDTNAAVLREWSYADALLVFCTIDLPFIELVNSVELHKLCRLVECYDLSKTGWSFQFMYTTTHTRCSYL